MGKYSKFELLMAVVVYLTAGFSALVLIAGFIGGATPVWQQVKTELRINGGIPGFRECTERLGNAGIKAIGLKATTKHCCDKVGGTHHRPELLGGECKKSVLIR